MIQRRAARARYFLRFCRLTLEGVEIGPRHKLNNRAIKMVITAKAVRTLAETRQTEVFNCLECGESDEHQSQANHKTVSVSLHPRRDSRPATIDVSCNAWHKGVELRKENCGLGYGRFIDDLGEVASRGVGTRIS